MICELQQQPGELQKNSANQAIPLPHPAPIFSL